MDRQPSLLLFCLDCYERHIGQGNGFTDRLGVGCIGLVRLHAVLNESRRHQLYGVIHLAHIPGPVMGSAIRFHANQARLELDEKCQPLGTRKRLRKHRLP